MADAVPASSGALVNLLANPPNPMDQLGKTANALTAAREFQAKQAIADAYRQATDPTTGQVDQGKLNAIISQTPGAFLQGQAMEQGGRGVQAQAAGTSASLAAAQDQLTAVAAYLNPLAKLALQNQPVTADQVNAMLDSIPPGAIPGPMLANFRAKVNAMPPGADLGGLLTGALYGTHAGLEQIQTMRGNLAYQNVGGQLIPVQTAAGGVGYGAGPRPLTMTPSPGEQIQQQQWFNTPIEGGYRTSSGQMVAGTREQWMHDFNVPVSKIGVDAQGNLTAPGAPPFAPNYATPPKLPPAQPPSAGIPKPTPPPVPPSPVPAATPQPPSPGQGNINQPTPPVTPPAQPPAPSRVGGGTPIMSPPVVSAGENAYNAAMANAEQATTRRTNINLALQSLGTSLTGGGTEFVQSVNNILGTYSPEWLSKIIPGYDPAVKAADRQQAVEYMQMITNASIPGGQGTNEKLAAAHQATPNADMQNMAAADVLKNMDAGERMGQYVMQQFQNSGLPPAQYQQFATKWATTHDPRAFMLNFMTPDQQAYLQKTLKPGSPDAKIFNRTVHELVTNGVIPNPSPGAPGTTPSKPPGTVE